MDENTGDKLYESQDIIHHLFKHYGKTGKTPAKYSNYPKVPFAAIAGTMVNGLRGGMAKPLKKINLHLNSLNYGALKPAHILVLSVVYCLSWKFLYLP